MTEANLGKPVSGLMDSMDQKKKQLDQANLDLLMNELEFDLESFKVYRQKVTQVLSSRARKVQDWKGKVVQEAQEAADQWLQTNVPYLYITTDSII